MTDHSNKLWTFIFICILTGNIVGYWIKEILNNNGYAVKYFSGHFEDTKNIFKLAKLTNDKNKRIKYVVLGFADVGIGIAFIASVIFLMTTF